MTGIWPENTEKAGLPREKAPLRYYKDTTFSSGKQEMLKTARKVIKSTFRNPVGAYGRKRADKSYRTLRPSALRGISACQLHLTDKID